VSIVAAVITLALTSQLGFAVAGSNSYTSTGIWCGAIVSKLMLFNYDHEPLTVFFFFFQFNVAGIMGIMAAKYPVPSKVGLYLKTFKKVWQ